MIIRVGPDIRQCRIIRPNIRLSGKKFPDIRQNPQGIQDYPAGYPASGKKKQIWPKFFKVLAIIAFLKPKMVKCALEVLRWTISLYRQKNNSCLIGSLILYNYINIDIHMYLDRYIER